MCLRGPVVLVCPGVDLATRWYRARPGLWLSNRSRQKTLIMQYRLDLRQADATINQRDLCRAKVFDKRGAMRGKICLLYTSPSPRD